MDPVLQVSLALLLLAYIAIQWVEKKLESPEANAARLLTQAAHLSYFMAVLGAGLLVLEEEWWRWFWVLPAALFFIHGLLAQMTREHLSKKPHRPESGGGHE